jgi:hypothetical protein
VETTITIEEFRESSHALKIARTTDRGIASEAIILVPGGFEESALMWFPRSAVDVDADRVRVPGWMILDRCARVEAAYVQGLRGRSYHERHRWCKGERPVVLRVVPAPRADWERFLDALED